MHVHPFRAITYSNRSDLSSVVAPPYDVLDAAAKQRLLDADPHNIVGIDLPHVPPKELGPPAAYLGAAEKFRGMLAKGTLKQSHQPEMFAYRQTFRSADGKSSVQRSGMACCIDTLPLGARTGGGVLPHEETFSGPKEDRLALMRATTAQMSPIFGLHADDRGEGTALLRRVMASRGADRTATTADGTLHEVWTITDGPTIAAYQRALEGEDVFIADGHHRYITALNYFQKLMAESGGRIGPEHSAARCMIVLVGMSDPGLVIWPTHRVLGGMSGYTFEKFVQAAEKLLVIRPASTNLAGLEHIEREMGGCTLPAHPLPRNVLGLYDFATERCYTATLAKADPLATRFANKPPAWRQLDVAIIQHAIVEDICQTLLNAGKPVKWAFPHTIKDVQDIGRGAGSHAGENPDTGDDEVAQLGIIVQPTPLSAVRDISRAGVVMPQKSTFFFPKLATGLFVNPLE